jgi:hypothetical protein
MKLTNQARVSIVAGVCLLALVIVLKNVIGVPGDVLSRDVIVYIIVYWALGFLYPAQRAEAKKSRFDQPLYWSVLIVLITLAIIVVYAI